MSENFLFPELSLQISASLLLGGLVRLFSRSLARLWKSVEGLLLSCGLVKPSERPSFGLALLAGMFGISVLLFLLGSSSAPMKLCSLLVQRNRRWARNGNSNWNRWLQSGHEWWDEPEREGIQFQKQEKKYKNKTHYILKKIHWWNVGNNINATVFHFCYGLRFKFRHFHCLKKLCIMATFACINVLETERQWCKRL